MDLRARLTETEEAYELKAELPGLKREDIDLNVLGDVLTLSGSFGALETDGKDRERRSPTGLRAGSFERQFQLGGPVEVEGIHATHIDGVLSVRLPKAASAKPLRIAVQGTASNS